MAPAALFGMAIELLRQVLAFAQPAEAVVAAFWRKHPALGARERHALAETVYAVLRQRLVLQHLARGGPGSPERRLAALGWQGGERALAAALDDEERRWLAGASAVDRAALPADLRNELPAWLARSLRDQLGAAGVEAAAAALNEPAPLDLRVNVVKALRAEVQAELVEAGITSAATPYSPWGLRLAGKPVVTRLPLFERGAVDIQDEGSQLLALLTGAGRGEVVVDFCAGSGGKTLALGAMMRNTGRLYAFDTSAHRLAALKPRLARSGLGQVHPVAIAHEGDERIARLAGKVDRVLVDAPCSGLGTLRRHPDLKWRQAPADVARLQDRQQAIVAAAARLLRPGGRLVYATCSFLREENEAVAEAFAQRQRGGFDAVPAGDALREARAERVAELVQGDFLRLWPHRHGTDGFFAAVWRRR